MARSKESVSKNLMLGLLYPAVLGNILYLAIGETSKQVAGMWGWFHSLPYDFKSVSTLKFLLLLVTLLFYFFDYLYITFTREFRKIFFLFDFVFVIFLYITIYAINLESTNAPPNTPPNVKRIVTCYLIFMMVYGIWDLLEWLRVKDTAEKFYYKCVLIWEAISILVLGVILVLILNGIIPSSLLLLSTLGGITFSFGLFAFWKRKFYEPEVECTVGDQV